MAKPGRRRRQIERRPAGQASGVHEQPSFTVADRDVADRAQTLVRFWERQAPSIWAELETARIEARTKWGWGWPEWCWVPNEVCWLWAFRSAFPGAGEATPASVDEWMRTIEREELLERGMELSQVAAAANWRLTRGIYRFHPELRRALTQTPVEDVSPEVLLRLPEWCVYVDLDGGERFATSQTVGFYAYVDWRPGKTPMLRLLTVDGSLSELQGFICELPLQHRTLAEAWSEMAKVAQGLEADAESKWRSALQIYLPLLVYLVSHEPDIGHRRDSERRPQRQRPARDAGGPNWWEVGYRVGAVLGRAPARGPASAVGGTGSGRSPAPHVRRGHYHLYWTGPGRQEPQVRWLHPMLVGDRDGHELPPTIRRVDGQSGPGESP